MLASQASRRYAEAFIEAAGPTLGRARDELEVFARSFEETPEFRHVLMNPAFTRDEEGRALDAVMTSLGLSDVVQRFIRLVAARERMAEIGDIALTVRRLSDERAGRVRAKIESASPLSDDLVKRLEAAIERRTKKDVDMEVVVDPALIGGVRTTVGSTVFDGTLKTELVRLREALTPRE
jgi:F-type H+-transporting ATPase subunit delta